TSATADTTLRAREFETRGGAGGHGEGGAARREVAAERRDGRRRGVSGLERDGRNCAGRTRRRMTRRRTEATTRPAWTQGYSLTTLTRPNFLDNCVLLAYFSTGPGHPIGSETNVTVAYVQELVRRLQKVLTGSEYDRTAGRHCQVIAEEL